MAKDIFIRKGLPTASYRILNGSKTIKNKVKFPCVVKPVDGGSAIGVSIVKQKSQMHNAVQQAFKVSPAVMVESFLEGRELTVPILGKKTLPIIEIIPKKDFYDYSAKYDKGMSDHILPAFVSSQIRSKLNRLALAAHQSLGCRGFSRVDFILDKKNRPWILEVNTIPGLTETSLFPEAAKSVGLSFPEMILQMMDLSRVQ